MAHTEIKQYIEGVTSASDRVRFVLIVMITASILSFSAFWNSRASGWVSQRLHLAKVGLQLCAPAPNGLQTFGDADGPQFRDNARISKLPPEDVKLVGLAQSFYERRHYHSCDNLRNAVREFDKTESENIEFIHVPFFGFGFDVNDLGMFSGIAFVVMLMWLRLSMESELRCVQVAFTQAKLDTETHHNGSVKHPALSETYRLLGMYQVFTRVETVTNETTDHEKVGLARHLAWWPGFILAWLLLLALPGIDIARAIYIYLILHKRPIDWSLGVIPIDLLIVWIVSRFLKDATPNPSPSYWHRLSIGLVCLPVLVLLLIFRNDVGTLEFGLSVSGRETFWLMVMEVLLTLTALQLTRDCIRIAQYTDHEWIKAWKTINPPAVPGQA
jgi:hypothetical protein